MGITITKRHLRAAKLNPLTVPANSVNLIHDLFEFGSIGAGIHHQGSSYGSRNPFGKFQSRIASSDRLAHQLSDNASSACLNPHRLPRIPPLNGFEFAS